jgi:integrase
VTLPYAVSVSADSVHFRGRWLAGGWQTRRYRIALAGPVFEVAIGTGMRLSEILGLDERYLHLDEGYLRVEYQLIRAPDGLHYKAPRSRAGRRNIELPNYLIAFLRDWLASPARPRCTHRDSRGKLLQLVFTNSDGSGLDSTNMSQRRRHWMAYTGTGKLELPRIRFHELRHSHATILLRRGVALKVISARLRHSTVDITSRFYAHVTRDMAIEAANQAEMVLAP